MDEAYVSMEEKGTKSLDMVMEETKNKFPHLIS